MKNKRIIWNFELNSGKEFDLETNSFTDTKRDEKWEARFFWPSDKIITISNLNIKYLRFDNCKFKTSEDIYYLLPNADYNIKMRKENLVYKPLLDQQGFANAYGKKIIIDDSSSNIILPGIESDSLLDEIKLQGQAISVYKERCVYKLPTEPQTKLELAKLTINGRVHFTISIEARSPLIVKNVSQQLLCNHKSCDYISFLKEQCNKS